MGLGIKIGVEEIRQHLLEMEERGENLSALMRFFGGYMKGSIRQNFLSGGRPMAWPALKLGTMSGWAVSQKSFTTKKGLLTAKGQRALSGRKRLINSGLLMNATFYLAGTRNVTIANNNPVAAIQNFGAKIPPIYPRSKKALFWPGLAYPVHHTRGAVIPPSPFMLFQDEDIAYFDRLYLDYLMTGRLS